MTRLNPPKVLEIRNLSKTGANTFSYRPDDAEIAEITTVLGLRALRKPVFTGSVVAKGKNDWRLDAQLGATAIQACVVTLADVTTRVDAPVTRIYQKTLPDWDEGSETEMPDAVEVEQLDAEINLAALFAEALALALPDYPRAEGAHLGDAVYSDGNTKPMTDEDAKPFAALAGLLDRNKNSD